METVLMVLLVVVWCSCSVAEVGDTVVGVDKVGQGKHDQEKKKQAY
jgi:hypothetical protein